MLHLIIRRQPIMKDFLKNKSMARGMAENYITKPQSQTPLNKEEKQQVDLLFKILESSSIQLGTSLF